MAANHILLVEDDDLKARLVERIIHVLSNRDVIRATTLRDALELMKTRPVGVITDWKFPFEQYTLPRDNGAQIASFCAYMRIPCIVHSGADRQNVPSGVEWPSNDEFLTVLRRWLMRLPEPVCA